MAADNAHYLMIKDLNAVMDKIANEAQNDAQANALYRQLLPGLKGKYPNLPLPPTLTLSQAASIRATAANKLADYEQGQKISNAQELKAATSNSQSPQPLSPDAANKLAGAMMGIRGVQTLRNLLEQSKNPEYEIGLVTKNLPAWMTGEYTDQLRQQYRYIVEQFGRAQSGAQINKDEWNNFADHIPQFGQSLSVQLNGLRWMENYFKDKVKLMGVPEAVKAVDNETIPFSQKYEADVSNIQKKYNVNRDQAQELYDRALQKQLQAGIQGPPAGNSQPSQDQQSTDENGNPDATKVSQETVGGVRGSNRIPQQDLQIVGGEQGGDGIVMQPGQGNFMGQTIPTDPQNVQPTTIPNSGAEVRRVNPGFYNTPRQVSLNESLSGKPGNVPAIAYVDSSLAKANRDIFYNKNGQPKTVDQVRRGWAV